ncbi:hypothetical protein FACS1894172_15510 [Spirochaetia bacterium]|nr:hypothetical protein FACS1894172_15510 [Spirochaetia bacterium]
MAESQVGLSFEQVWAMFEKSHDEMVERHVEFDQQLKESKAEFDQRMKESKAEFDRGMRESKAEHDRMMAETDRRMEERSAETDRRIEERSAETAREIKEMNRELNRAIGKLGNRFGDLVEHLVSPNLVKKFNELGYVFTKAGPRVVYKDAVTKKTITEVDVLLENGDYVLAVEVKAAPDIEDVRDHIKRMEALRGYANEHHDKRVYLGAVAGGIISEDMKHFIFKSGFYAIEQSGDTMQISIAPAPWKPKAW